MIYAKTISKFLISLSLLSCVNTPKDDFEMISLIENIEKNLNLQVEEDQNLFQVKDRLKRLDSLIDLEEDIIFTSPFDTVEKGKEYRFRLHSYRNSPVKKEKAYAFANSSLHELHFDSIHGNYSYHFSGERLGLNECAGMIIRANGDSIQFPCSYVVVEKD